MNGYMIESLKQQNQIRIQKKEELNEMRAIIHDLQNKIDKLEKQLEEKNES